MSSYQYSTEVKQNIEFITVAFITGQISANNANNAFCELSISLWCCTIKIEFSSSSLRNFLLNDALKLQIHFVRCSFLRCSKFSGN